MSFQLSNFRNFIAKAAWKMVRLENINRILFIDEFLQNINRFT